LAAFATHEIIVATMASTSVLTVDSFESVTVDVLKRFMTFPCRAAGDRLQRRLKLPDLGLSNRTCENLADSLALQFRP